MAVGVTAIASKANVSNSLVSRYLNADPSLKIKHATKLRIEKARKDLGIVLSPNSTSVNLAKNFVMPVNVVLQNSMVTINPDKIKPLERVIGKRGFRLSATFFDDSNKSEVIKRLIESSDFCDGIFFSSNTADADIAELILSKKTPHISIEPRDEDIGLNTVVAYSFLGFKKALKYLTELGHRNIGYIGVKHFFRYRKFITAMQESGLPVDESRNICISKNSKPYIVDWRNVVRKTFLDAYNPANAVTAYVCHSDEVAFGVMDAMRELGLEPGRDISIIGYDNIAKSGRYYDDKEPALTTIDNPVDIIGKRCGERLLEQVLYGHTDIIHEHVPTELIIRKTTGWAVKNNA